MAAAKRAIDTALDPKKRKLIPPAWSRVSRRPTYQHPRSACLWRRVALWWRPCPNRPPPTRQQKITPGEMRSSGVRGLLVYCADYKCAHAVRVGADRWPDHVRLSDLELLFICQARGRRGADIRP